MASSKIDMVIKSYQQHAKQMEEFAKNAPKDKAARYRAMASKATSEAIRLNSPEARADFEADVVASKARKKEARAQAKKGKKATPVTPVEDSKPAEKKAKEKPVAKEMGKVVTPKNMEKKETKKMEPAKAAAKEEKKPDLKVIKGGEPTPVEDKTEEVKPAEPTKPAKTEVDMSEKKESKTEEKKEESKTSVEPVKPANNPAEIARIKPKDDRTFDDYKNTTIGDLKEASEASKQLEKYGVDGSMDINADLGTVTKKYEKVSEGVFAPTDPEARKRWEADRSAPASDNARELGWLKDELTSRASKPVSPRTPNAPGAPQSRAQGFSAGHGQTTAPMPQAPAGGVYFAPQNQGAGAVKQGNQSINISSDVYSANQVFGSNNTIGNVRGGTVGGGGMAASTKGRATTGKGGVAVSTGGPASSGAPHPRAKNATAGRPTTKKANPRTKKP